MPHAKELKECLRKQLRKIVENTGLPGFKDPKALDLLLNTLLIRDNGAILRGAQRKALADHALLDPAGELPEAYPCEEVCPPSLRIVYGIYPPGLNTWERAFAGILDSAAATTVRWWHRNPVNHPYSVAMVRADGRHFYADFVIGMEGRKTTDGVLLTGAGGQIS